MALGNYEPCRLPVAPVPRGAVRAAALGLAHGHIFNMCGALEAAGGEIAGVWDGDREKVAAFLRQFPGARVYPSPEALLGDETVQLAVCAAVPADRAQWAVRCMEAGKDFFVDKAPFTTLAQADAIEATAKATGRKYYGYYSERLHSEAGLWAGEILQTGALGQVVQVMGWGPHRLSPETREPWFFRKSRYGGILIDIGSHQAEQFLAYAGAETAEVRYARAVNLHHPQTPELEDFGEMNLLSSAGVSGYSRVDWFTPDGLSAWGDGRTLILCTGGYIELRKYVDIARGHGDRLYIADGTGEYCLDAAGKVGFPYFSAILRDVLERTDGAMSLQHTLEAGRIAVRAQNLADAQGKE